jgi:hypothetical protein
MIKICKNGEVKGLKNRAVEHNILKALKEKAPAFAKWGLSKHFLAAKPDLLV